MEAPSWAKLLATIVVKEQSHHAVPLIEWRNHARRWSSGVTYLPKVRQVGRSYLDRRWRCRTVKRKISIHAGTDFHDQKLVLLHELAHWISPRNDHHSIRFWRIAVMLYKTYGVNMAYAKEREKNYMRKSVTAFCEAGY